MQTISMFYGIIIRMFNNGREHNPPHIHAEYQGQQAVFDLDGNLLEGGLPTKQRRMVTVWASIHHDELVANWELASSKEPLFTIDPLR